MPKQFQQCTTPPQRLKDWLGAVARVKRDLRRADGQVIKAGTRVVITSVWCGRIELSFCKKGALGRADTIAIRQALRSDVELLFVRIQPAKEADAQAQTKR